MSAVRIWRGSNIQQGGYYQQYCIIYLEVAEAKSKIFLVYVTAYTQKVIR